MEHAAVRTVTFARDRLTEIVAPNTATVEVMPHTVELAVKSPLALALRLLPQVLLLLRLLHQQEPRSAQMVLVEVPVASRVKDRHMETVVPSMVTVGLMRRIAEQAARLHLGPAQQLHHPHPLHLLRHQHQHQLGPWSAPMARAAALQDIHVKDQHMG